MLGYDPSRENPKLRGIKMNITIIIAILETMRDRLELNNYNGEESEYILDCNNAIKELKTQLPEARKRQLSEENNTRYYIVYKSDINLVWGKDYSWKYRTMDKNEIATYSHHEYLTLTKDLCAGLYMGTWRKVNW